MLKTFNWLEDAPHQMKVLEVLKLNPGDINTHPFVD